MSDCSKQAGTTADLFRDSSYTNIVKGDWSEHTTFRSKPYDRGITFFAAWYWLHTTKGFGIAALSLMLVLCRSRPIITFAAIVLYCMARILFNVHRSLSVGLGFRLVFHLPILRMLSFSWILSLMKTVKSLAVFVTRRASTIRPL